MANEAFISYTSKDRDWAKKLYDSLNAPYFPVFYDQEGLDAGEKWNDKLRAEVNNSNHLIILWSSESMQRQWVYEERNAFENKKPHGLIIFVCLDMDNEVKPEYQSIKYIKEKNLYDKGADKVDGALWKKLVNKIRAAIYKQANSIPINRVVFTMTKERLQQSNIPPAKKTEIENNYNERFADWRPFGSIRSIENILDELLYVDINQKSSRIKFYWEDIDWKQPASKLWLKIRDENTGDFIPENQAATAAEITKLESEPCVLILDPYALNDTIVKNRFERAYNKCALNSQAVIMALDSFPLSKQLDFLRQQLQNDASGFYDSYFEPRISDNATLAECFANTIDDKEIRRNLRVSLKNIINNKFTSKQQNSMLEVKSS